MGEAFEVLGGGGGFFFSVIIIASGIYFWHICRMHERVVSRASV